MKHAAALARAAGALDERDPSIAAAIVAKAEQRERENAELEVKRHAEIRDIKRRQEQAEAEARREEAEARAAQQRAEHEREEARLAALAADKEARDVAAVAAQLKKGLPAPTAAAIAWAKPRATHGQPVDQIKDAGLENDAFDTASVLMGGVLLAAVGVGAYLYTYGFD